MLDQARPFSFWKPLLAPVTGRYRQALKTFLGHTAVGPCCLTLMQCVSDPVAAAAFIGAPVIEPFNGIQVNNFQ